LYYNDAEVTYCYSTMVELPLAIALQLIVLQKCLAIEKR